MSVNTYENSAGIPFVGGYSANNLTGPLFDNVQWGSRDGEADAGTAVLYLQAYHEWPEEDTLFDARYNVVLHFNPRYRSNGNDSSSIVDSGVEYSSLSRDDSGYIVANWERYVDNITSSVEYRVPSVISGGESEYTELGVRHTVSSGVAVGNPNEWKVDRSRNRKLLPYVHKRKVIGIRSSATTIKTGEFSIDEIDTEIECANGIRIKPTSFGEFSVLCPGSGFAPMDFAPNFEFTAGSATLSCSTGEVTEIVCKDDAPKKVVNSQKINVGSGNGRRAGTNGGSVNVNLTGELHPKGKYNLFFFFQNDCSIVSMTPWVGDMGFQFLEIEIV